MSVQYGTGPLLGPFDQDCVVSPERDAGELDIPDLYYTFGVYVKMAESGCSVRRPAKFNLPRLNFPYPLQIYMWRNSSSGS